MINGDLTIFISFVAGIVSFLSPCVLPIIPGFLAYLAGATTEKNASRWSVFAASLFFVLGFSIVFAAVGVILNSFLESAAYQTQVWLGRLGGVIIIIFGLYLMGLLKINFLAREHKFGPKKFNSRVLTSLLFGAAFAAGWTPCVGAVLGGILGLATALPGSAFLLLLAYSLGLGLPFLLTGLFASRASGFIARHTGKLKYVNPVFGLFLVALGVLAFTQNLSAVANFEILNKWLLK